MILSIIIKASFTSLLHHKGRSSLTTLGIIIGIASIIALLAIGHGAEERIKQEVLAMGSNSISIYPGSPPALTYQKKIKPIKDLTMQDAEILKQQCSKIKHITPITYHRQQIKYQTQNPLSTMVKGGDEEFLLILDRKLLYGSFIQKHDVQKSARVMVLGFNAAKTLFKTANPVGKIVLVNNIAFTIIGVLEELKSQFNTWEDANQDTFIPVTTAKKYFDNSTNNKVRGLFLATQTPEDSATVVKEITQILRARHRLEYDDASDFFILDQEAMLKAAQAASGVLTLFLFFVALISLLIGGIGVMNIMLVSVGERTKEIGIRMAIGAPPHLILQQFLFEAIILCTVGGLAGVGLGCIVPIFVTKVAGIAGIITISSIMIAFLTIFFIGTLFGYYPAYKASRLNPVDALQDQ